MTIHQTTVGPAADPGTGATGRIPAFAAQRDEVRRHDQRRLAFAAANIEDDGHYSTPQWKGWADGRLECASCSGSGAGGVCESDAGNWRGGDGTSSTDRGGKNSTPSHSRWHRRFSSRWPGKGTPVSRVRRCASRRRRQYTSDRLKIASISDAAGIYAASDKSKASGGTAPSVAALILTAKSSEGWRCRYTILRMVLCASPILSAKSGTLSPVALR